MDDSDRGANDEGYDNPRFAGEDGNWYSDSPPPPKVKKTTAITNKYFGRCSGCGDAVPVGKGFAEKFNGNWKPFCKSCFTDRRS